MKKLGTGEHPGWMLLAFALLAFIFILHGSWSRSETFAVPGIASAGVNASVGGTKGRVSQ